MKIVMGSDHAGYSLKEEMKTYLTEKGYEILDVGTYSTESVDYPDFGHAAGRLVAQGKCERGIVICGSGIGISIAANKVRGVRCALCSEPLSAQLCRQHNDANMIAMGARLIGTDMAKKLVDIFLETPFLGERHARRCEKIEEV